MKAVIVTGGKQYTVSEGDVLFVEKLNVEADATVKFDQVLAVLDGENTKIGAPVVEGAAVIAKVGFSSSLVFYDAMLPEVTTDERMDTVSSCGYAFGYIGSVIPFVVCLVLVLGSGLIGLSQGTAMVIAFLLTAVWWIVCTLPLLRSYRQSAYVEQGRHPFADTFRQLGRTIRDAKKEKHIFLYLLAFFFFIDGVYTIIDMATAYGTALGLDSTGLLLALLLTQIVAFPCSILFGRLSRQYDTALLIKVCIACYTGITMFAVFLQSLWQFWMLAVLEIQCLVMLIQIPAVKNHKLLHQCEPLLLTKSFCKITL